MGPCERNGPVFSWCWSCVRDPSLNPHWSLVCVTAGVSAAALLHSTSLRGHRDCFEKCHVIANQKLSCSGGSRSTYEGLKLAVSQKLNRIIQYTQTSVSFGGSSRHAASHHCYSPQSSRQSPPSDFQVPRYTRCWDLSKAAAALPACTVEVLERRAAEDLGLLHKPPSHGWSAGGGGGPQEPKQSTQGTAASCRPGREERKNVSNRCSRTHSHQVLQKQKLSLTFEGRLLLP